ncbi:MAG: hypothetical protein K1060chlam1_00420 [Candidatus Anoxychlamydiales bacterium]|nr:hypothetical protein [Candidatus Anoxychlamydiales bacterium]
MTSKIIEDQKIIESLQSYMIKLRKNASLKSKNKRNDITKIIMTEIRKGYLDDKMIDRLVVFLKGTGCIATKRSGGCTFCGFYNATNFNEKISDESYFKQFEKTIINSVDQYPVICIYNDGSLFCEEEISFSVVKKFMEYLENLSFVKKVVLESRIVDLTENKIIELKKIFSKKLEIAVGFESANSQIRDFCINKSFTNEKFEEIVKFCKKYDVDIIPLMIFKPTFLTEKEAIDDYINSLIYLDQFNLKRIDMEILTIEKDTLAHLLWEKKLFYPPWLWSIVETLKIKNSKNLKTQLYISPISYSVKAEATPSNCDKCNQLFFKKFNEFNKIKNISIFDNLKCTCTKKWKEALNILPNIESIPLRVLNFLENIKITQYI